MFETPGSVALRYLSRRPDDRIAQGTIAQAIGVTVTSVSRWQNGRRRPDAMMREKIRRVYGIPFAAWLTPDEREFLVRAEKVVRGLNDLVGASEAA